MKKIPISEVKLIGRSKTVAHTMNDQNSFNTTPDPSIIIYDMEDTTRMPAVL